MKKSDENTQSITIETRLPRGSSSELLSDYARLFSRLSRFTLGNGLKIVLVRRKKINQ